MPTRRIGMHNVHESEESAARRKRARRLRTAITAVVIAVAAALIGLSIASYADRRTVTATVTDKERVCETTDSGSECKYLIFTDEGTFRVEDSLLIGRFDSSDVYGRFREDRTYRFEVYGWRIPFASSYPNVATTPEEIGR